MTILPMNVLMQSQMIQLGMNQTEWHCSWLQLNQKCIILMQLDKMKKRLFKLVKGKKATTSFLPQTMKGGWVRFHNKITCIPDKENFWQKIKLDMYIKW